MGLSFFGFRILLVAIVVASDVLGGVFPVFFWEGGVLGGVGSVLGCLAVVVCGCRWLCGAGRWMDGWG